MSNKYNLKQKKIRKPKKNNLRFSPKGVLFKSPLHTKTIQIPHSICFCLIISLFKLQYIIKVNFKFCINLKIAKSIKVLFFINLFIKLITSCKFDRGHFLLTFNLSSWYFGGFWSCVECMMRQWPRRFYLFYFSINFK